MKLSNSALLIVLTCLLCVPSVSRAADLKIALVNLNGVFEKYYKTRLAEASIKGEADGMEKDRKALIEEHERFLDEYKKAVDEANNQAVSAEEREKRKTEAEGKLLRVQDIRKTIEQFDRTARGNLESKHRLAREKILKEIQVIIDDLANDGGYDLILDSSPPALDGRPHVVLFNKGSNDLTKQVLAKLNADAPEDLLLESEDDEKDKNK
jgi:Skp family chaperone for outer membrane proteins